VSDKKELPAGIVAADAELKLMGRTVKLKLEVPTTLSPPESLLPALHVLASKVTEFAYEDAAKEGKPISCKAGCGACCRQCVPLAVSEARAIAKVVANMPEPRQSEVRQRFADALDKLKPTGLLQKIIDDNQLSEDHFIEISLEYFKLGVPCPFLVNESCSIYEDRPLICREYVVISPPKHCAEPTFKNIQRIKLPTRFTPLYHEFDPGRERPGIRDIPLRLPLVMALEWTEQNPDDIEYRPGTEWLRRFFSIMGESEIPKHSSETD
jgi:Fe-S-cluster containining protein